MAHTASTHPYGLDTNASLLHGWMLAAAAWTVPAVVFLAVYAPAVGHGFISDDFRWILTSRISGPSEALDLFRTNLEFYRPLVALSFAANYALAGSAPLSYGLTNLALALLVAGLLVQLLREVQLPTPAAAFGAAIWLLNFHGLNMALLWISGRTALLLTAAALCAVLAALRGRLVLALLATALALLSKEEAIVLPAIVIGWVYLLGIHGGTRPTRAWRLTLLGGLLVDLVIYAWLRTNAGAITAATAPDYYRFTFAPGIVTRNAFEYLDRAGTFAAFATLLAWVLLRPIRALPPVRWPVVACGLIWLVGGYALTVFLPVRSSLYACFPSVGACVIAADYCARRWPAAAPRSQRVALAAIVLVPLACAPIYIVRNDRWTELAEFSVTTLDRIAETTAPLPDGAQLLLVDDRSTRVNLKSSFGTLLDEAIALELGRRFDVQVDPPLSDGPPPDGIGPASLVATGPRSLCADCPLLRLVVHDAVAPGN